MPTLCHLLTRPRSLAALNTDWYTSDPQIARGGRCRKPLILTVHQGRFGRETDQLGAVLGGY